MCRPGDDKVRLHTRGEACAAETANELAIQHVDVMSAKEGRAASYERAAEAGIDPKRNEARVITNSAIASSLGAS
jgi:hypothetical protein